VKEAVLRSVAPVPKQLGPLLGSTIATGSGFASTDFVRSSPARVKNLRLDFARDWVGLNLLCRSALKGVVSAGWGGSVGFASQRSGANAGLALAYNVKRSDATGVTSRPTFFGAASLESHARSDSRNCAETLVNLSRRFYRFPLTKQFRQPEVAFCRRERG